jgi:hypothetical protein
MAMAGIDLPTLRELAGHANIQMTMRYLHPTPQHKVAAITKLEMFRRDSQEQIESHRTPFSIRACVGLDRPCAQRGLTTTKVEGDL